ncbi:hypothetical protein M0R45_033094 [Rubus argutus]|uniref:Uncharacterized protein n=1 Tax=Rubus argutus TaxID=59490 RepID=A0AAW1WLJ4_RUBAR
MALGRVGKNFMAPLLTVNLVVHLIVVGLAGWSLDKYIDGQQNHPHLGGNASTSFMLIFALIAGAFCACSVVVGMLHLRAWQHDSHAAAASLAIFSWAMITLAFGFVCKEAILGGHRGKRLQTLEFLIAISVLSQLLYLVILNAGMFKRRYGPTVI